LDTYCGQPTLTNPRSAWRQVINVPSISGKTFGTNGDDYLEITLWVSAGSTFNAQTGSLGLFNNRITEFYGIHERVGDVPIEAINYYQPPDPQAELARCQRYFEVMTDCMRISNAAPNVGQATFATQKRAVPTLSNVTVNSGSGATFSASKTSVVQIGLNSTQAIVSTLWADAEL
jgi:hypothetical protein